MSLFRWRCGVSSNDMEALRGPRLSWIVKRKIKQSSWVYRGSIGNEYIMKMIVKSNMLRKASRFTHLAVLAVGIFLT